MNTDDITTPRAGRALLAGLLLTAVFQVPALAQATEPTHDPDSPCTDGVFFGDVQAYYQEILDAHAADPTPSDSFYSSLTWKKKAIVDECATRNAGPDSERYTLRELAMSGDDVIGRVYDYLDPIDQTVCSEKPASFASSEPTVSCRTGRWYHVAVVLSACYTDNVFGDDDYAASVGWNTGSQGPSYRRVRSSDQSVAHASCTGSPGFSMTPFILDLAGSGSLTDGGTSIITNADSPLFNENMISPLALLRPFGMHAATSTVWNMLFSRWDVGDNNANGTEERDGDEGLWTSPWVVPGTGADTPVGAARPLCTGLTATDTCDLGYATTWFDSTNLWEWSVVYEFSWDVSSCTPLDADDFVLDFDQGTHASPSKQAFELCTDLAASLTLIKDSVPDNPWNDFRFNVTGPTPGSTLLQDPGAGECTGDPQWPACGTATPWNAEDRFAWTDLVPSTNASTPGPYRVTESAASSTDITGYTTTFECRNVNPATCSVADVSNTDPLLGDVIADPFEEPGCAAVQPSGCGTVAGFVGGVLTGTGLATPNFTLCEAAHVICKFTNEGGAEECVESANAIGDLQVFGAAQPDNVAFSTGAVPVQSGDAADSIFLSSFTPIADVARWPGNVDHFILPLPVVEDEDGDLVPDFDAVCADQEDTSCLAWRAGEEMLAQAPTATEVIDDRRIGDGEAERRVTYTQGESSTAVPRVIRAFDWSDSDAIADKYDLWDGFGLSYTVGIETSEDAAFIQAQSIINQTLQIRTATIADPDSTIGETIDLSYVAGDFFHSDPHLVAGPANFFYLANDLEGNGEACDDSVNPNEGYRCFFEKQRRRRRVLIAGSNEGQIHGFDAGTFNATDTSPRLTGQFTFGTGKEVFAHIPRPMLEHAAAMTMGNEHDFGVDGSLVSDDFFIDPEHNGTPNPDQREWRTVVIGTYREGARGVFALDVTQPDPMDPLPVLDFAGNDDTEWVPLTVTEVPGCTNIEGGAASGCGTLTYPAMLWEFDDTCVFQDSLGVDFTAPCDQDSNGQPDLGFSWSQANTGRIQVIESGETVVKHVAFLGGGLDPADRFGIGNFLYMVDVETGKAIYKRELTAGAPSEPAAVDTDQNGIVDTLYIGTVDGLMHKVDLSSPADYSGGLIGDTTQWAPFAIFDTEGRTIFYPPTVLFVASQGRFAIAFGTGDREDLFSETVAGQEGRFYTIVDSGFTADPTNLSVRLGGVLTESSLQPIVAADPVDPALADADFLTAPLSGLLPGWVLQLDADERVVTKALALSGLMVFSTFIPETELVCEYGGNGRIYGLGATNANSIAGISEDRFTAVEGFAGRPVVMPEGLNQTSESEPGEVVDPFEAARIQGIRSSLMDLFPSDCRFGSFSLNIGVTLSNTSQVPVASVPVCISRRNWTEHF